MSSWRSARQPGGDDVRDRNTCLRYADIVLLAGVVLFSLSLVAVSIVLTYEIAAAYARFRWIALAITDTAALLLMSTARSYLREARRMYQDDDHRELALLARAERRRTRH